MLPPSVGGSISVIFACSPPEWGGATPILGSILGVGGEQGGSHAEISGKLRVYDPPFRPNPGENKGGSFTLSERGPQNDPNFLVVLPLEIHI